VSTITYVPEYQVVLTHRCLHTCGYCNFPNTPTQPLPSAKQLRRFLKIGSRMRATQITLTAGELAHEIVEVHKTCRYYGFIDWADYLRSMCTTVLTYESQRVLFPVLDVGRLPFPMLKHVSNVVAAVRLLVDTADDGLMETLAHDKAPHKTFDSRVVGLEELGRLRIPACTGTRVGIGEREETWAHVARRVNTVHRRFRNIASFAIVPFRPLPYTAMAFMPAATPDLVERAVAVLREELDKNIPICVESPDQPVDPRSYLAEELTDIGIVRMGSSEKLNIDVSHVLGELAMQFHARGDKLCERLPWMNKFMRAYELSPAITRSITNYVEKLQQGYDDSSAPFLCVPPNPPSQG